MQYLRLLLLPFSMLYSLIIRLRNKLYDAGIFSSNRFDIPVISIGNIAVGGAGKTPMAEYIISLLKDKYKLAVLSRGYKRETKGFRLISASESSAQTGDEPLQFKKKFGNITVAVSEKRVEGIEKLKESHELIILDDAFQHRAVKPGLSILLFDYTRLNDFLIMLPAGNLREPFSGRKRADVIIVSKCPENISREERENITRRIKPFKNQLLFFSYLSYGNLIAVQKDLSFSFSVSKKTSVFLLTGIANPSPLLDKLKVFAKEVIHHDYPDHHPFSTKNISKLAQAFKEHPSTDKIIITTEKDAQRLHPALLELLADLPVYYLPISTRIHQPDEDRFNALIEHYASEHIHNNRIY